LALCAISGIFASACGHRQASAAEAPPTRGSFRLITYNVAGLPELLSASNPAENMSLIGERLNDYDVALVQEDFFYHRDLEAHARHEHQSREDTLSLRFGFGDGLGSFSRYRFAPFERHTWRACNGRLSRCSDCLTDKGFTWAMYRIAPNVSVHVYNIHMDAGTHEDDENARHQQIDQLLAFMQSRSRGQAVIVAGDTNLGVRSERNVKRLLAGGGLTDACRAQQCAEPGLLDRVMYRSSASLTLSTSNYKVERAFVDSQGEPLSDHDPVAVTVHWERQNTELVASRSVRSKQRDQGARRN
jgi:endonuclease/exonuclease/phosphatase family metal-dependent hydrolase